MKDSMLWKPTPESIAASNLTHFMQAINQEHALHLNHYAELYNWSIQNPTLFWKAVWEHCQILASQPWDKILTDEDKMPGARWFNGAQLNFANNLLRYRDHQIALHYYDETGQYVSLTYQELYQAVSHYADYLKKAGIKTHDRVAGYLPNIPETVIAMLATASLGAIWSSCSPDFGAEAVLNRFSQIEPKFLFTTDCYFYNGKKFDLSEKINVLKQQLPSLQEILILPYSRKNNPYWLPSQRKAPTLNFAELPFNHPLYILYSSGTTNAPKCIVHGAGGTLIQHLKELVLHCNLTRQDTIFFFTTCGWMMWNWLVSSLAVGATLVLYEGSPLHPSPTQLFDLIDSLGITVFGTSAKFLLAAEKTGLTPIKTHALTTLQSILTTGSPLMPSQFDWVYQHVKSDLRLSSISGGTDIISCFALGNPLLPVYRGELQCRGLGLKVEIFDEEGRSIKQQQGELVCTAPFPSMPLYFWNDPKGEKYHHAYFEKYSNVWTHGDFAELTEHDGIIIYGRSDTTLNPGGVRIGTAEIYQQVEKFNDVLESIAVTDERLDEIILFVTLRPNQTLTDELVKKIKQSLRDNVSPRHVPKKIIHVPDLPRTANGKLVEVAVQHTINQRPVKNLDAIINPETLNYFKP